MCVSTSSRERLVPPPDGTKTVSIFSSLGVWLLLHFPIRRPNTHVAPWAPGGRKETVKERVWWNLVQETWIRRGGGEARRDGGGQHEEKKKKEGEKEKKRKERRKWLDGEEREEAIYTSPSVDQRPAGKQHIHTARDGQHTLVVGRHPSVRRRRKKCDALNACAKQRDRFGICCVEDRLWITHQFSCIYFLSLAWKKMNLFQEINNSLDMCRWWNWRGETTDAMTQSNPSGPEMTSRRDALESGRQWPSLERLNEPDTQILTRHSFSLFPSLTLLKHRCSFFRNRTE